MKMIDQCQWQCHQNEAISPNSRELISPIDRSKTMLNRLVGEIATVCKTIFTTKLVAEITTALLASCIYLIYINTHYVI